MELYRTAHANMTLALHATLFNHLEMKKHKLKIDGFREFKGIVHRKNNICCECTHPQATQDVHELFLDHIFMRYLAMQCYG